MPLFGSKTEVGIELARSEVVAGEEVAASVDVGELDKKAQAVRVELGYKNTYKEDSTDSDGDTTTTTSSSQVVVHTEQLASDAGATEVRLAVPPDAPGSSPKSVDWFVRAVVDRKRGRDASASEPLTVLVPLSPLAPWSERPAEPSDKCAMELSASARAVRPGDTISGTLTLQPHEKISARAVRVQLRRRRDDPDRNTDEDDSTRAELCGETELTPGETRTLDFTLDVPADAPPSFRAAHNAQHWLLEGVIDVKRSSDPTVRVEVVVHTA